MKRIFLNALILVTIIFTLSCSTDNVFLNGTVNVEIEVHSVFVDPGISTPEGYTILTEGFVNTEEIGQYTIEYTILNTEGETVKELTRVISVIDSTNPELSFMENLKIFIGIDPDLGGFYELSDNYYSNEDIIVANNISEINPQNELGIYNITFSAEDPSGNLTLETVEVEFVNILIGENQETIDVYATYIDQGINIPDNYTYTQTGDVNTELLGEYIIVYTIRDELNSYVMELFRTINVVDRVSPTANFTENLVIYIGMETNINSLIQLSDNYASPTEILVVTNLGEINPDQIPGNYMISVTIEDPSGNQTVYQNIEVQYVLDIFALIQILDTPNEIVDHIGLGTYPSGEQYYNISLTNGDRVIIREDNSFHYMYDIESIYLGASINISANYGEMNDIWLYSHITSDGEYSNGNIFHLNALINQTEMDFTIDEYWNNANIPLEYSQQLLNDNSYDAIIRLRDFIENVLGLIFK